MSATDDRRHPSRRIFLRDLAATTLGGGLLAACARTSATVSQSARATASAIRPTADRVGVQLFTVRDRMQTDFEGTLAQVAQAGYREVEFFSYNGRTPAQVKAAIDRAGLRAPSTHAALRP